MTAPSNSAPRPVDTVYGLHGWVLSRVGEWGVKCVHIDAWEHLDSNMNGPIVLPGVHPGQDQDFSTPGMITKRDFVAIHIASHFPQSPRHAGLPDDGLADVGGDEEGDARAQTVALLQQLIQADDDDTGEEELQDDEDCVQGAQLAHIAVHAGHDVRHGLADGKMDRKGLTKCSGRKPPMLLMGCAAQVSRCRLQRREGWLKCWKATSSA
eukprot:1159089-Pelagomonas_calceolata.AAC.15